jgi:hypothetical protein
MMLKWGGNEAYKIYGEESCDILEGSREKTKLTREEGDDQIKVRRGEENIRREKEIIG